jgi:hypothetical protein
MAASQGLVAEVLTFCEIGSDEDVTPRDFSSCWRAAADAAASSVEGGANTDPESAAASPPDAAPLQGGRANEATSAAPRAGGRGVGLRRGGEAVAAAAGAPARRATAERDVPSRLHSGARVMWLDGAGESGPERATAAPAQPRLQRRGSSLRQSREHRWERGSDQGAAASARPGKEGAPMRRSSGAMGRVAQQSQPAHYVRYAAGASVEDVLRPTAARDSSQFGGKLSVRRYAQGAGAGQD